MLSDLEWSPSLVEIDGSKIVLGLGKIFSTTFAKAGQRSGGSQCHHCTQLSESCSKMVSKLSCAFLKSPECFFPGPEVLVENTNSKQAQELRSLANNEHAANDNDDERFD